MRALANVSVVLGLSLPVVAAAAPNVEATGLDAIGLVGQPTRISAKFERKGLGPIQPDIARAKVRFSLLDRRFTDLTDPDGVAEATISPVTSGVFPFLAKLIDSPSATPARGTLYVVDRARPLAVVDVDGTISDLPSWRVVFRADRAKTYPGAPELLRDLAKTHQIVYLTARDDHFAAVTRAFLARHSFPPGPVLFNRWGLLAASERDQLMPSNHGAFKLKQLETLKARGLNVTLGIGNAETDATAYEAAGIKSCIRTSEPGEGATFRFTSYAQLRKKLVADGVLKKTP